MYCPVALEVECEIKQPFSFWNLYQGFLPLLISEVFAAVLDDPWLVGAEL
jgi:hypothetical protein